MERVGLIGSISMESKALHATVFVGYLLEIDYVAD